MNCGNTEEILKDFTEYCMLAVEVPDFTLQFQQTK